MAGAAEFSGQIGACLARVDERDIFVDNCLNRRQVVS